MKELIFGPSGSGKTYISGDLRKQEIPAVDADAIEGLSSWYDGDGNKVPYPRDADQEFLDNHSFLWDKGFLKDYLDQHANIYLFGTAGNVFDMLDLFDKVYFMKVPEELQKERLMHQSRKNPMGETKYQRANAVAWGKDLEAEARKHQIPFIDATLTPKEIYTILTK